MAVRLDQHFWLLPHGSCGHILPAFKTFGKHLALFSASAQFHSVLSLRNLDFGHRCRKEFSFTPLCYKYSCGQQQEYVPDWTSMTKLDKNAAISLFTQWTFGLLCLCPILGCILGIFWLILHCHLAWPLPSWLKQLRMLPSHGSREQLLCSLLWQRGGSTDPEGILLFFCVTAHV